MFTLILLTFLVFFILWLADFYITVKIVNKKGRKVEANPLMRLYLIRGRFVWVFKIAEILIFFYLLSFLTITANSVMPFYTLLAYIFIYTILVANNSKVYFDITGKQSNVLHYVFIVMSILLIFFIYMNYLMYSGLTLSYNTLMDCQSEYKQLNWDCYKKNVTIDGDSISKIENILGNFDLPIPIPG